MEAGKNCSTGKCEDHNKVDYILRDLTSRLDSIDNALVSLTKLSARVTLLISVITVGSTIMFAGCIYTFTALPTFKETYSIHILETQKQLSTIQEEGRNFTRAEVSKMSQELCGKISALDAKVTSLDDLIRGYRYQTQAKKNEH